jgi:hypothetical protein
LTLSPVKRSRPCQDSGNAARAYDLAAAGDHGRRRRAAPTDDLRAGKHRTAAGEAEDDLRAAVAPSSVPPARMVSVPPLRSTVGSATPPDDTTSAPPLDTIVLLAAPPTETIAVPPPLTAVATAAPLGRSIMRHIAANEPAVRRSTPKVCIRCASACADCAAPWRCSKG